ncbi:MAG: aminodeoxychorismate lyase [Aeromonas sp.]
MAGDSLVNGQPHANIALADRGLHYGDGHFTTLRVKGGRPLAWPYHFARLQHAHARLHLPSHDWATLFARVSACSQRLAEGVLKILLTRGQGGAGYDSQGCDQCAEIILSRPLPAHLAAWQTHGVALHCCAQRLGPSPMLAGLKSLNRLEQVLLRREVSQLQADEGIVLTTAGHVVEAVSANLFWRCGQNIYTPCLSACGIDGIMRQQVMRYFAMQATPVNVVTAPLSDVLAADEVWLTNAIIGCVPVAFIGQKQYVDFSQTRILQERLVIEV